MGKKLFTMILIFLFLPSAALAAPSGLRAVPMSETRVDLFWKAQPGEVYRVWQSTDGAVWNNVYTFGQPGASSYSAVYGIQPYVNYYFAITTDAVTDYVYQAQKGVNATGEAVAFPPDKHAHAYYSENTDMCKNCHQTHTAAGNKLLRFPTVNETCISCHDGTGSKYVVTEGAVNNGSYGTLTSPAGPFGGIIGSTAMANPESIHTVGTSVYEAPGGNPLGSGDEWTEPLGCVSCHDAHDSPSYRMLTVKTPDNQAVKVEGYAVTDTAGGVEYSRYVSGVNEFCMGCHKDYYAGTGAGHIEATGTYSTAIKYRHAVGISPASYTKGPLTTTLPLEGTAGDNTDKIICLTCHKAHGSTSVNDATKSGDTDGPSQVTNYLLRRDYSGVCQDCHKK